MLGLFWQRRTEVPVVGGKPDPLPFVDHSLTLTVRGLNTGLRVERLATDHFNYKGADKSLARPGRKQATATKAFDVHVSYL